MGESHGTQAAALTSRRQVPFFVLHILRVEAPQNAVDPDLTQTGNFSEVLGDGIQSRGVVVALYADI